MDYTSLIQRDLKVNWHPCSQMKDHESFSPLVIERAEGPYIYTSSNGPVIDAISSWWCKSLGHGHPRLKKALLAQSEKFEHTIFANATYPKIVELSESLLNLWGKEGKVFYAGDGSMAVEIALKCALQFHINCGLPEKNKFMALDNGYHGESSGALAVSALGLYRDQYKSMLMDVPFIKGIPYVSGKEDPLWKDMGEANWQAIKSQLETQKAQLAAIILEPLLQGAGGMKLYSLDFLNRLQGWCRQNKVLLIADEILTGMGRLGVPFAGDYADIKPDMLCLSKGLTAGWMPFSATLIDENIYQAFYDDYSSSKAFLHSNTYSGNALGAALALEALNIYKEESIFEKASKLEEVMRELMDEISHETGLLKNIRALGAFVAADLDVKVGSRRWGYEIFQEALKKGAWLRPLGNTIYWLPPLNIPLKTLVDLKNITLESIKRVLSS